VQNPVVIINKITHEITYTGTYYYLAHFSKFVRPGATRLQTTGKAGGVRVMAFQAAEGGFVAEILNSLDQESAVNLDFKGRSLHLPLQARSITTLTW
jgi:glucosylceramidase